MRDYIATIGATAAVLAAATFAAFSLPPGEQSTDRGSSIVPVHQVSAPVSSMPDANGNALKKLVEDPVAKSEPQSRVAQIRKSGQEKPQSRKPVITIEEIDPNDQKQSIKAKLEEAKAEEAKAEEARKAQAKKRAEEKPGAVEDRESELKKQSAQNRKAEKNKKADSTKARSKNSKADEKKKADDEKKMKMTQGKEAAQRESDQKMLSKRIGEMQSGNKRKKAKSKDDESEDPGRITFGTQLKPFEAPEKDLKIPGPNELINANTTLLTQIVNSQSGPSPEELHGTWEVMPCHSSVGVIAKRSFKTIGLTQGQGAYFEIVQFYSDREKKVFGPYSETTIYVKLDPKHMLAAVNANTNMSKFSVLRKISSEVQEEPEEMKEEMKEETKEEMKAVLPGKKKKRDAKSERPSASEKKSAAKKMIYYRPSRPDVRVSSLGTNRPQQSYQPHQAGANQPVIVRMVGTSSQTPARRSSLLRQRR